MQEPTFLVLTALAAQPPHGADPLRRRAAAAEAQLSRRPLLGVSGGAA